MNILVTGGAGYIGSHAVKRLLTDGHNVTIYDNLDRGHREAVAALKTVSGGGELGFVEADINDEEKLHEVMSVAAIDTVMHFAALAYVGESVTDPLRYFYNNTSGALALLRACDAQHVRRFIFSSTCATYGEPPAESIPIAETCPQSPINPYGWSKLFVERILKDYAAGKRAQGDTSFSYAALRYFNVAGSDPDGLIGEDHEPETHLIPVILLAALGQRDAITIFGTDYDTPDGTCIRDYVHVNDLVDAHVTVMNALEPGDERVYNLGIGNGYSVREIIDAAKEVTGIDFKVVEGERRAGDPPQLYADPSKIRTELGWSAKHTDVREIIEHAWGWFREHPKGY
ncbi:MAG: UDP-glucose 4-epimerase GalE [Phycisphaerales bacterium]